MSLFSWFTRSSQPALPVLEKPTEELNLHSHGYQAFSASFRNEQRISNAHVRQLATGRVNFGNGWRDWLGIGSISTGVAVTNTTIGVLAAVGVVAGAVSLGIGLAVTLMGVAASMGFAIYRNKKNIERYQQAAKFLDESRMEKKTDLLQTKVAQQFANQLNHCTRAEARQFAKHTSAIMTEAIVNKQIKHTHDLLSPAYLSAYAEGFVKKNTFNTKTLFNFLRRKKESVAKIISPAVVSHTAKKAVNDAVFGRFNLFHAGRKAEVVKKMEMQVDAPRFTPK